METPDKTGQGPETGNGTQGLIFKEPLLWEKSKPGRCGISIPLADVEVSPLDPDLVGEAPSLPELYELDVVRHYTRLSQWNIGIDSAMYPLGSCTMKYNPKTNDVQAARIGFAAAHPLADPDLSQGALELMHTLEGFLAEIAGMAATTLQPAAGAHGELAGMMIIHAYHAKNGRQRTKILIPDTAHGTNPASAALCGYAPVNITSSELGMLTPKAVGDAMDEDTAGIMITNPNTLGLFEEDLKEICDIVHQKGGLVYGDGANMNAVLGIVRPGELGMDVVHYNLHKTFSTPHGGGGPGSGPISVVEKLVPFLPGPRIVKTDRRFSFKEKGPDSIGRMLTFYGHFGILVRAYAYIRSLGPDGLKRVSQLAVLNANYIKESLKGTLDLAYDRPCMHECVFSDKGQAPHKVTTLDMAKRLMDYGFHPPTIYFPLVVHGALMIEPTETESKETIDGLIHALKAIAEEARTNPDLVRSAPHLPKMQRLDEVTAARKPCLCG